MTPNSYFFENNLEKFTHPFYYRDIIPKEDEVVEFNWHMSDNEKRFKSNLSKFSNIDSQSKSSLEFYKLNPISYKVNHYGFRDDPLSTKPKKIDLFLGCSFTFGTGVHIEDTWTYKLGEFLNFPTINAGLPGSGVMTQFRALLYLSSLFEIRNIFHIHSLYHSRYEWWEEGKYVYDKVNLNYIKNYKDPFSRVLFNSENLTFLHNTFHHAFLGVCNQKNINYFSIYDLEDIPKSDYEVSNRLARDLLHPSVQSHKDIFQFFLKLYER